MSFGVLDMLEYPVRNTGVEGTVRVRQAQSIENLGFRTEDIPQYLRVDIDTSDRANARKRLSRLITGAGANLKDL